MDDTIRSLLRFVARGFYLKQYVLILDAVLIHSVLSEDDLNYLLGINPKQLRALCYKLVDDRLLTSHIQKEDSGQQRLTTRTYYYIHITEAIDAIKWKVHSIVNQLKDEMSQLGNPHGYVCTRCGKKVSQLDAISLLSDDKLNFECDNCGSLLVEDNSSQHASLRQARLETLMSQIDPIIAYLKKIDDMHIQDNNFEEALTIAIPARTSSSATYTLSNKVKNNAKMSSALQNAASKSQATLNVSITANDENYEREQLEKERVRQKLEQNALPSWHSGSTVGKESTPQLSEEPEETVKTEDEKIEVPVSTEADKDKEAQDVLAAYYADLAEQDADDDDDDDDAFDDFEDI